MRPLAGRDGRFPHLPRVQSGHPASTSSRSMSAANPREAVISRVICAVPPPNVPGAPSTSTTLFAGRGRGWICQGRDATFPSNVRPDGAVRLEARVVRLQILPRAEASRTRHESLVVVVRRSLRGRRCCARRDGEESGGQFPNAARGTSALGVSGGPHRSRGRTSSAKTRHFVTLAPRRPGSFASASGLCRARAVPWARRLLRGRPADHSIGAQLAEFWKDNPRPASLHGSVHARGGRQTLRARSRSGFIASANMANVLALFGNMFAFSRARSRRRCVPRRRRVFRRAPRPWSSRLGMTWSGTRPQAARSVTCRSETRDASRDPRRA